MILQDYHPQYEQNKSLGRLKKEMKEKEVTELFAATPSVTDLLSCWRLQDSIANVHLHGQNKHMK